MNKQYIKIDELIIKRHKKIALQFSGGRDSLAVLYLMRDYWDAITVYWLNTGCPFPETLDIMSMVRRDVPSFVEVKSDQWSVAEKYGMPSDVLPASSTMLGVIAEGDGIVLQDRYSCCCRTIMEPMHSRMREDNITLIIRGQKNADRFKSPAKSGFVENGIELYFPIQDWTNDDVMSFLAESGIPIPRFYQHMNSMPDCMDCTAWWDDGRAEYMHKYHPEAYKKYVARLGVIGSAISKHVEFFNREIENRE